MDVVSFDDEGPDMMPVPEPCPNDQCAIGMIMDE
jgi:hypothetical protein